MAAKVNCVAAKASRKVPRKCFVSRGFVYPIFGTAHLSFSVLFSARVRPNAVAGPRHETSQLPELRAFCLDVKDEGETHSARAWGSWVAPCRCGLAGAVLPGMEPLLLADSQEGRGLLTLKKARERGSDYETGLNRLLARRASSRILPRLAWGLRVVGDRQLLAELSGGVTELGASSCCPSQAQRRPQVNSC